MSLVFPVIALGLSLVARGFMGVGRPEVIGLPFCASMPFGLAAALLAIVLATLELFAIHRGEAPRQGRLRAFLAIVLGGVSFLWLGAAGLFVLSFLYFSN